MSWLAVLLAALAALPGAAPRRRPHHVAASQRLQAHAPTHRRTRVISPTVRPVASATPVAGVVPTATATPTPAASPTATPYPSRTGVDFDDDPDYILRPTYRTLQAGQVEFLPVNFGMDSHNLTVASTSGHVYGAVDLPPDQQTYSLTLTLPAGTYRLYCSLPGHAAAGMDTTITLNGP